MLFISASLKDFVMLPCPEDWRWRLLPQIFIVFLTEKHHHSQFWLDKHVTIAVVALSVRRFSESFVWVGKFFRLGKVFRKEVNSIREIYSMLLVHLSLEFRPDVKKSANASDPDQWCEGDLAFEIISSRFLAGGSRRRWRWTNWEGSKQGIRRENMQKYGKPKEERGSREGQSSVRQMLRSRQLIELRRRPLFQKQMSQNVHDREEEESWRNNGSEGVAKMTS